MGEGARTTLVHISIWEPQYGNAVLDGQNTRPYTPYMTYSERIEVRVTPEEKALLKKAAHRREMTLAEFTRTVLKEAAKFYVEQA